MKCPSCKTGDIHTQQFMRDKYIEFTCSGGCKIEDKAWKIIHYNNCLRQAERLGWQAFRDGKDTKDNPFKDEVLHEFWYEGYYDELYKKQQEDKIRELTKELKELKG
ncbi:hypothetical protein LCGC14_1468240 [marine sediment metagenome]|uniref:Uncharacterized protein n=1 Tax=marine sediment metagenome TaxID=412755 RepID=A0A0F9JDP7_9ZZZZ